MEDFLEKELLYKEDIRRLRSELKTALLEKGRLQQKYDLALQLPSQEVVLPSFLSEYNKTSLQHSIPVLFFSDWHWGEIVDPEEIGYSNKYNLDIARERSEYCLRSFLHFYKDVLKVKSRGMVLILGGDMVSGEIHDEITETNEVHTLESTVDCAGQICGIINELMKYFEEIIIFGVSGNHGRFHPRMRHKKRNSSNFDYMVYSICQMKFQNHSNVQFCLPKSADCSFEIHGLRFLLTHGDLLGGSMTDPIIGAQSALSRGDQKLRKRQESLGDPYDVLVCGHWHQYSSHPRRIINGSLKGYDEFAYQHSFYPEKPIQATWLVEPELGITVNYPIICE